VGKIGDSRYSRVVATLAPFEFRELSQFGPGAISIMHSRNYRILIRHFRDIFDDRTGPARRLHRVPRGPGTPVYPGPGRRAARHRRGAMTVEYSTLPYNYDNDLSISQQCKRCTFTHTPCDAWQLQLSSRVLHRTLVVARLRLQRSAPFVPHHSSSTERPLCPPQRV